MHPISQRIYDLMSNTPGVNRSKLAEYLGVSRATVTKWFNDPKEPEPEYKSVVKAAEFFMVDPYCLLDLENQTYIAEQLGKIATEERVRKMANRELQVPEENNDYYTDPETTAIAQKLASTPGAKTLLDAYCDMPKEDAEFILQMVEKLTNK